MTLIRRAVSTFSRLPDRLPTSGVSGVGFGGGIMGGVNGSPASAMGAYGAVGSIYGLVRRIAEPVSMVQWNLNQQDADGEWEYVDDAVAPAHHPATALWSRPNPWMTSQFFLEVHEMYQLLTGESYWLMTKPEDDSWRVIKPKGRIDPGMNLWPISPARIKPIPGTDHWIAGYLYSNGVEQVPLDAGVVVRTITPDPNNIMRGLGPIQAVMSDIEAERYAALWNRNFFLNSAEPGGIIQFDTPLSDMEFEKLVTRWREQHQGVSNAFRVAILERGTWVDRKYTQRDMQWQQLRTVNWDQFRRAVGVAASIMGDNEHSNRSTADSASATFAQYVLKHRLERIKQAVNEFVIPLFGDNLALDYVDPTPADEAQNVNLALAKWYAGVATLGRTVVSLGDPPLDDGDPRADQYIYEVAPQAAPQMPKAPPTVPDPASGVKVDVPAVLKEAEQTMKLAFERRLALLTSGEEESE